MAKPNLLFVFGDQHRSYDLGCYGNAEVWSPYFDQFSTRALRFENCISNTPLCVPARAAMLTGNLGLRHRAAANDLPIDTGVESIAGVLGGAGYRTGYIGKWHLAGVPRDKPVPQAARLGFQEWKAYNCSHEYDDAAYYDEADVLNRLDGYEPVGQTELAIDFMNRHHDDPWALFLSWGPPHDPYRTAPAPYLDRYDGRSLPLRANVPETIRHTQSSRWTRDDVTRNLAGYYAHISALDEQFGRLIAALESTGQLDDTIIVYTSDHGDMMGSQGLTNKQLPYEEAVNIPLLVSWPRVVRTGVTAELIGQIDLPVTLLSLMGLRFSSPTDGSDLHQVLLDPDAGGLEACYLTSLIPCHQAADRGDREWRAIRTRRHTFARSAIDDGYLLYDNLADPYQLSNLVDDPSHADVRDGLRAALDTMIDKHDVLLPWEDLIRHAGLVEAWNESQAYFGRPTLPA
ncbi:sulfatase [Jiangella asiatica]|uniref:Sulfatase N-terminal domain-containing protein n=1 Tax=Jiangella asiatica TaxID=2530372 RepID=A0A4R5DJM5_9ACTN|nr:sulfatase [Jiangella asiatica]TDE14326.1 hypothetical protein E1269_04000 [Jiangella asiatica]